LQNAVNQFTGETVSIPAYEPCLELIFGLVRRLELRDFAIAPTSFYGCLTIAEVRRFAANYPGSPIYEFQADHYEVCDMAYLKLGTTATQCWINARKYWARETSDNPAPECLVKLPITIGKQVATV
jgi:hypothetical protein